MSIEYESSSERIHGILRRKGNRLHITKGNSMAEIRRWPTYVCHRVGFSYVDFITFHSKYSTYTFSTTGDNGELHPVDKCLITFRNIVFVYRKSVFKSTYLFAYRYILLGMSPRPVTPWLAIVPPPWLHWWTNSTRLDPLMSASYYFPKVGGVSDFVWAEYCLYKIWGNRICEVVWSYATKTAYMI